MDERITSDRDDDGALVAAAIAGDFGAFESLVQQRLSEFAPCTAGGLQGKIAIRLTIGADGSVKGAAIASSDLKDAAAGRCILQAMKRWAFPASSTGRETTATIEFILKG